MATVLALQLAILTHDPRLALDVRNCAGRLALDLLEELIDEEGRARERDDAPGVDAAFGVLVRAAPGPRRLRKG